ncbi:unnamed protein product [Acanthoscelides obtectus]|uniref:Uncharacterized protein n=1 Tax=Acanthoscelides obtectus TaxID=200917 RepID=A0A9P0M5M7_ACAOB|nr:unnamed protein product [Acanthoscelides obtectus]CAK1666783.1 hypothetical protein AOBTE_LOCUS25490 [Acanthoscelides obtectus]
MLRYSRCKYDVIGRMLGKERNHRSRSPGGRSDRCRCSRPWCVGSWSIGSRSPRSWCSGSWSYRSEGLGRRASPWIRCWAPSWLLPRLLSIPQSLLR